MSSSEPGLKRSSSDVTFERPPKRAKRPYHHVHHLQRPLTLALREPAVTDGSLDQWMCRAIAASFKDAGFDMAQPVALECVRQAAEECTFYAAVLTGLNVDFALDLLRLATHVRHSMLSSRRIQPIPQDFEHALKRQRLRVDDLYPYLTTSPRAEPLQTASPTLSPEDDLLRSLPFLGPHLSGENDRADCRYIPKHLPQFPSRHTYRYTPVFTEREQDPRKIRERATEDGRQGEDALRRLARAAFKDNQLGSTGQDKKAWIRKMETMDSMFEKTVKGIAKSTQKLPPPVSGIAMEIDSGNVADPEVKRSRSKAWVSVELPPIVNCERDFWRRSAVPGNRVSEKSEDAKDAGNPPPVDEMVGAV